MKTNLNKFHNAYFAGYLNNLLFLFVCFFNLWRKNAQNIIYFKFKDVILLCGKQKTQSPKFD